MYCSSCGMPTAKGISYCNYCGAKLTVEKDDKTAKSAGVKPEALVWAMVAVLVFGFAGILFLIMAMKMVGLNVAQILAFTVVSFLMMIILEGVFTWQLFSRRRDPGTLPAKEQTTKELYEAQARVLTEPAPSVTEHTTRAFDPIYTERNKG